MKRILPAAGWLWIGVLCASGSPARSAESFSFTWQNAEGWGGRSLVAPQVLLLSSVAPAPPRLNLRPRLSTDRLFYGSISLGARGREERMAVVLLKSQDGPERIYIDGNADRVIDESEGAAIRAGGVGWTLCQGMLSARIQVDVPAGEGRSQARSPVSLVFWHPPGSNTLFYAAGGFLAGKVEIKGALRDAFLVDGNGDGLAGNDREDQLWIDRNGDGQLDLVSEEFVVAPTLRLDGNSYSFVFSPLDREVRFRQVEGGLGKARLAYDGAPGSTVKSVAATLVSQGGDIASVTTVDGPVALPAGHYHVNSLSLQIGVKGGEDWTYSFSSSVDANDNNAFPIKVDPGGDTGFSAVHTLHLDSRIDGDDAWGSTLKVKLSARSETGLDLVSAARSGASGNGEDYARIQLLDPLGRTVSTASTGFQ